MSAIWGVRAEDIVEWVARYEAAAVLPDLVRRLLLATPQIEHIEARTGSGVRLHGWDVVASARTASPFCPSGVSVWELSTDAKTKAKATKDLRKREQDPPAPIDSPADATYVVVTARRFPDKNRWVADEQRRGVWRGLKVLDADDLAMWLELCPAVAYWFASEQLGRPVAGWRDLRSWRRRWELRSNPPLTADLVLIDRRPQLDELHAWLQRLDEQSPPFLRVRAQHREEAGLFLAAAVTSATGGGRTDWARVESRTLVVESLAAWRRASLLNTSIPLLLVPTFDGFDPGDRSDIHATLVPTDPSQGPPRPGDLRIEEPLPWRVLEERLRALGRPDDEAERLARESGGNLGALQRSMGGGKQPAWVETTSRDLLVAMLLMGAWEPGRDGDASVVEVFGVQPTQLEAACVELASGVEPPISRRAKGWAWVSHADAWFVLARMLTDADLRHLRQAALVALGSDDPRYDLPKDERWAAAVHDKLPACSDMLREGITESLVRLSLVDDQLVEIHQTRMGSAKVELIVSELLGPQWKRWASLSEQLPVLAEAAPRVFMERLETSLDREDGVARLLAEEPTNTLAGPHPHTGLLWALETLGWDRERMPRVAHALARLAEVDSGGRGSNRPLRSLGSLFDLFAPQTLAGEEDRRDVLEGILERYGDAGWTVLLGLLSTVNGGGLLPQSHRPRFLPWSVPREPEMPTWADVHSRARPVLSTILREAGCSAARWVELISNRYDVRLPGTAAKAIYSTLRQRRECIDDPSASVWLALRKRLEDALRFRRGDRAKDFLEELQTAYDELTPSDPCTRARPLFRPPFPLAGAYGDFREKEAMLRKAQQEFLDWLSGQQDRSSLLEQLVRDLDPELDDLGAALAHSDMAEEIETRLFGQPPNPPWDGLVRRFVAARRASLGFDWLATLIRDLERQGRTDEVVRVALSVWSEPEVWDLLDELDPKVQSPYWTQISMVGEQHADSDYPRALGYLLEARNAAVALELASFRASSMPTESLLQTLQVVLETAAESDLFRTRDVSVSYDASSIFDELDGRDDVDLGRAAMLESHFAATWSSPRDREPRFLNRVLETNPDEFSRLVELVYRPLDDSNTEQVDSDEEPSQVPAEPDEKTKARARWAYHVLESWSSFPGADLEDPELREKTVFEWAEQALASTRQASRRTVGELEVAKVLARVPGATDGHWPCLAARRLLEAGRYPDLGRGLSNAEFNRWGIVVRVLDDGAEQTALANRHAKAAIAVGKRWPRTAAVLDDLADTHRRGADRDAKRAREDRLLEGRSSNPSPAVAESSKGRTS